MGRYMPWLLTSHVAHIRLKPLPFLARYEIGWVRLISAGEEPVSAPSEPCTPSTLTVQAPTSRDAPQKLAASYGLLQLHPGPAVTSHDHLSVHVRALNTGEAVWLAHPEEERGVVRMGWRWLQREREVPNTQGRASLGHDVFPEQRFEFQTRIRPPLEPGEYTLELGLVSELVTWFADQGVRPLRIAVTVHPPLQHD
jgi:hypothetical protein